jgi:peptidoglycan-associated lipoprotein
MTHARLRLLLTVAGTVAVMMVMAGCKKKPVPPPPPPPAPAAAATVQIKADPTAIQRGESSTLTWTSTNAVSVELNGTAVNLNGSQQVSPTESTDYEVVAKNSDGKTATASVRVTVTQPPPPPPPAQPVGPSIEDLFNQNVKDAFFDFDKSDVRGDAQSALTQDAEFLKAHSDVNIIVEGHCDDRGSAEYNMGLGDRRANSVRDFLIQQGVDGSRIRTVSYGKEKPFCTDDNEQCWQQNRRGHIVMAH